MKYSILFPGGGYFYTGHPWLGIADAFAEVFLFLMMISGLFLAFGPEGDPEVALILMAIFGVFLIIEKLVTIYHAQHFVAERVPADREYSL